MDIVARYGGKEFVVALVVVSILTVILAALFSSPDDKQLTLAQWAKAAPNDFVATAATELDGTSGSATYGAPYTHDKSAAQKIGPLAPSAMPSNTSSKRRVRWAAASMPTSPTTPR